MFALRNGLNNLKRSSMEWLTTNPKNPGKYIVETKTRMGNTNRFESYWNGESWSFTNQVFVRYLKEK